MKMNISTLLTILSLPMTCTKLSTTSAVYTTSKGLLKFFARFEMSSSCSLTDETVVSLTVF